MVKSKNQKINQLKKQLEILRHREEMRRIDLQSANRRTEHLRHTGGALIAVVTQFFARRRRMPRSIKSAIQAFLAKNNNR